MPKLTDIRKFLAEEDGPTTVEYALLLAMILGVCIVRRRIAAGIGRLFLGVQIAIGVCRVVGRVRIS